MATSSGKSHASILVASDSPTEAALVKSLLEDDFDSIAMSVDPDRAVEDFQRYRPDVLLLAFKDLQMSEDFYLTLYRRGGKNPPQRHRAVILCTKEAVKPAYELCRRALFDDYVLFWPVNHDVTRLLMSVHHALDALAATSDDTPSVAAFAAQARGLSESEAVLSQQVARAQEYITSTGRAVDMAEKTIGTALASLSVHLGGDAARLPNAEDRMAMASEIARLRNDSVLPQLRTVSDSLRTLTQWADSVQEAVTPHLESTRALCSMAERVQPTVLVVDDDEFQCNLLTRFLESEPYKLQFAASGSEALGVLCRTRPDLILMDFQMPDLSGIDVVERLKANPQLANIPVIMVTGTGTRAIVLECQKLGVADFVVKPIERLALIAKIARVLHSRPVTS